MSSFGAKLRVLAVSLTIFILYTFLIIQFFNIQVLQGEKWSQKAEKQHIFYIKEPFMRGTFYASSFKDKHLYKQLAIDVPKYHLFADCVSIPKHCKKLVTDYLVDEKFVEFSFKDQLELAIAKPSRSRKLIDWLDIDSKQKILTWWQKFSAQHKLPRNALFMVKDYQRSYPYGNMLGQVLHTIRSQKDEVTSQGVPTGGLELYFSKYLEGSSGKKRLLRSPRNALETGIMVTQPEHGQDIYLTIDPVLQSMAEEEVAKGVKYCGAKSGWAVMMEPKTGQIVALAQYPSFDLLNYRHFYNDAALVEHTKVKAVTDANEPGSVFKPFIIAIAFKANEELLKRGQPKLFDADEKISTASGNFPGRTRPISDTRVHKFLNLNMAMQKSSNIYMGRLVQRIIQRLGNDWFREQIRLLGFDQKTGVELPAESAGVLPRIGKKHQNGALEWSLSTPYSIAMGYNIQVNTIQLLRAMSILANGGYLNQPTIIKKIMPKFGGNETQHMAKIDHKAQLPTQVISQAAAKTILDSMCFVTNLGGTAAKAGGFGYTVAGKTSTCKKIVNGSYSKTQYVASFVGMMPASQPSFVMAVVMDEPTYGYVPGRGKVHNGGNCAALVFKWIAQRAAAYLSLECDDPYNYTPGDPRRDMQKSAQLIRQDLLQKKYNSWNNN